MSASPAPANPPEELERLAAIFDRAVRQLGDAGRPHPAARLAAEAWSLLRVPAPVSARRLEATLHYLTLRPTREGTTPMQTDADATLDVRQEPPARRHALIFDTWSALAPGAGFVLVNDHDPKPLWYQFDAEHAGEYTWDYLEQGPEVWRVRIGRTGG